MPAQEEVGEGGDEKVDGEVGQEDDRHEFGEGVEEVALSHHQALDGHAFRGVDAVGNLLSLSSHLRELQFFVGVGRVVKPLPETGEEDDTDVFREHGHVRVAEHRGVFLDQIGIVDLGKVVVVAGVVLDVPRLGNHPIEPIVEPAPEGADAELESRPPALVGVALLVSPVADVVGDHRPPRKGVQGQTNDGDGVHPEAHRQQTDRREVVRPADHLVEVGDVVRSLGLFEFLAELLDFLREGRKVEFLQPLVFLRQLCRQSGVLGGAVRFAHGV
mmetsp:Transcript_861/g.2079  ORF Transcript_861/g.2079 Transcript_861/m.2079 type:complete len:273 (+) Transcript_861:597-1415(+)